MKGDAAAKWLAGMQSPTTRQNYINGVNSVQVNPAQKAAEAQDRYLAGVMDAVNSGRMKARLMATSLQDYKTKAAGKGADRLAAGAAAAAPKMAAHFQKWGPIYDQASAAAAALPKGGKSNAMARVAAVYDIMKQGAGKSAS